MHTNPRLSTLNVYEDALAYSQSKHLFDFFSTLVLYIMVPQNGQQVMSWSSTVS